MQPLHSAAVGPPTCVCGRDRYVLSGCRWHYIYIFRCTYTYIPPTRGVPTICLNAVNGASNIYSKYSNVSIINKHTHTHTSTNTQIHKQTHTHTTAQTHKYTNRHTHTKTRARAHIACIDSRYSVRCIGRRWPCTNRCRIIVLRNAQKHIVVSQPYGVFGEMFEKRKYHTPSPHSQRHFADFFARIMKRREPTVDEKTALDQRTELRVALYCYYTAYSIDDGVL